MSLVSEYVDSDSNDKTESGDKSSDREDEDHYAQMNQQESKNDVGTLETERKKDSKDRKRVDNRDRTRDDDRDRRLDDHRDRRREDDRDRRKRDDKSRRRSGDRERRRDDDRDRRREDDKRKYRRDNDRSHYRDDRRSEDYRYSRGNNHRRDRGRSFRGRGGRSNRAAEEEYQEYRRKKFGDNMNWGKVSEESLKDVKTDSTLPSAFDGTIAKQLAAQREKRKLLWSSSKAEASSAKTVWGAGALKDDNTGEQTAKFLKLMGVKDVTAENVQNYQADESVLRSSDAVEAMEQEYEKSRYMQHINKGIGLGLIQFKSSSSQKPS